MTSGSFSPGKKAFLLSDIEPIQWMLRLLQNNYPLREAENELGKVTDLASLIRDAGSMKKKLRNYAVSVLARCHGIRSPTIAKFLRISERSVYRHWKRFHNVTAGSLDTQHRPKTTKATDEANITSVFTMLHSPPSEFGINRTSWIMADLKRCLAEQKVFLSKPAIRTIIRGAGYTWRRAKVVLTSNDPLYRQKLRRIHAVLSSLGDDERFFCVDEFGPLAIKMKAGRRLVAPGEYPSVPQFQKSKGCLIVAAALELSTNQVTHFYSKDKNTEEMIRLLELLLSECHGCRRIYLSWDAASWHISKKLKERVYKINAQSYRRKHGTPSVTLASPIISPVSQRNRISF